MVHHAKNKEGENINEEKSKMSSSKSLSIKLDRIKDGKVDKKKKLQKEVVPNKRRLRNNANEVVTISSDEDNDSSHSSSIDEIEISNSSKIQRKTEDVSLDDEDSEIEEQLPNYSAYVPNSEDNAENGPESSSSIQRNKNEKVKYKPGPKSKRSPFQQASNNKEKRAQDSAHLNEDTEAKPVHSSQLRKKHKPGPKCKTQSRPEYSDKHNQSSCQENDSKKSELVSEENGNMFASKAKGEEPDVVEPLVMDDDVSNAGDGRKKERKSNKEESDKESSQRVDDDDSSNESSALDDLRNILHDEKKTKDLSNSSKEESHNSDVESGHGSISGGRKKSRSHSPHSTNSVSGRSIGSGVAHKSKTDRKLEILPNIFLTRLNDATLKSAGASLTATITKRVGRIKTTKPSGKRRDPESEGNEVVSTDDGKKKKKATNKRPSHQRKAKEKKPKYSSDDSDDSDEDSDHKRRLKRKTTKKSRRKRDSSEEESDEESESDSRLRRKKSAKKKERRRRSSEDSDSESDDNRRHRSRRKERRRKDESSSSDRSRRKKKKTRRRSTESDQSESSEEERRGRKRRSLRRGSKKKRRSTSESEDSDESSGERWVSKSKKKANKKKTTKKQQKKKKRKKESTSESSEREIFASSGDETSGDENKAPKKMEGKNQSQRKKKDDETSEEEILSPSKLKKQLETGSEEESELEQQKETSRLKVVKKATEKAVEMKRDKGRKRKLPEPSSGEDVSGTATKRRKKILTDEDHDSEAEEGSDDEERSDEDDGTGNFGRKNIRKIMKTKKISKLTKKAELQEKRRKQRILERQKHYNEWIIQETGVDNVPVTKRMILEKDGETDDVAVEVSSRLIKNLKPHQVEAVQFMWNCLIESVARYKKEGNTGSGCILAHCMGLGKTLSVIAIAHTLMKSRLLDLKRVLIICPLNTVLNWLNEWKMWVLKKDGLVELYAITAGGCDPNGRIAIVRKWYKNGGVLIVGYDMYRNLALGNRIRNKKIKVDLENCLLDPGPDLVVCDEGHLMKNPESSLSKVVNRVKTRRRIVLTGTPLQNNLKEYYTMVSFVKPNLLGSKNEFANRFVNPITNGQHSNSTSYDVKLMKKRAHILYKTLDGCVHRRDYSALTKYLPPKYEYIIYVRLSDVQRNYYSQYLEHIDVESIADRSGEYNANKNRLFMHQQVLYRVWTHPYCLKLHEEKMAMTRFLDDEDDFISDVETDSDESSTRRSRKLVKYKENSTSESETEDDEDDDDDDDDEDGEKDDEKVARRRGREVVKKWGTKTRGNIPRNIQESIEKMDNVESPSTNLIGNEWWHENYKAEFCDKVELSGKMSILMHLLRMCSDIGDKVIIFSQSLISLDLIEHFLAKIDEQNNDKKDDIVGGFSLLEGSDVDFDDDKSEKSTSKVASKENDPSEETSKCMENGKSGNEETDDKVVSIDAKDGSNNSVESNSNGTDGQRKDADEGEEGSEAITKETLEEVDLDGDTEKHTDTETPEKNESKEDSDEKKSNEEREFEESKDKKSKPNEGSNETKSEGGSEIEKISDETDENIISDVDKESKSKDGTPVEVMDTTECEPTGPTEQTEKPVNGEAQKDNSEASSATENVLHDKNEKASNETIDKDAVIDSISLTNLPELSLNSAAANVCGIQGFESQLGYNSWVKGVDYHRLDGSTSVQMRKQMAEGFNDVLDNRLRLFLISTRAGGLGINLVAANRVIIFDASWNPSHDVQSIFRTYRFGQTKPVYVYRLIAQGTMEEKIYNRQVTKQSLSSRVIDEMNIERHYTESDLADLYNFTPDIYDPDNRGEKPALPRDRLLADLIDDHPHLIQKYHVHDSLLENKGEDDLTEEEISEAWQEFEMEKKRGVRIYPGGRAPVGNYLSDAEIAERQILHFAQALCQMHPQLYGMMRDRVCMLTPHLTQQPVNLCRMTNEFVLNVLKLTPVQFAQEYGRWMQEQQRQRVLQQLVQQQQQIAQQLQQPNLPPQIVNQLQAQQLMVRQQQNELLHQEQMIQQQSQSQNQTVESNQGQQRRLPTLSNPIVIDADD